MSSVRLISRLMLLKVGLSLGCLSAVSRLCLGCLSAVPRLSLTRGCLSLGDSCLQVGFGERGPPEVCACPVAAGGVGAGDVGHLHPRRFEGRAYLWVEKALPQGTHGTPETSPCAGRLAPRRSECISLGCMYVLQPRACDSRQR